MIQIQNSRQIDPKSVVPNCIIADRLCYGMRIGAIQLW